MSSRNGQSQVTREYLHQNQSVGGGERTVSNNQPRVVVLGAGFGGLWAARKAATGPVDVSVVDRHNYHTFFPLLYQVGAAELEPEDIAHPVRSIIRNRKNIDFYLSNVEGIDLTSKTVRLSDEEIPYDYLIIGVGSSVNFYGVPGAAENAFPLKSLDQGVALRNHILYCFEHACCEMDPELRRRWLTFTIVGGGPTGVEFAGALMELIRGSLHKDYPALDESQVRVLLLEAYDHLLDGFPSQLSDYALKRLQHMGVEVRLKSQVVGITPESVSLKDGETIVSETVIWTAGVQGEPAVRSWGLPVDRHGLVEVLPTLQVAGHPEVYVVGDLAHIEQDRRPLPGVAQVAIQSGTAAAQNILRQIHGQEPLPFHYRDKGTLAVIGRNSAVAYVWGRSFTGFLAWVLWLSIHIFYLIGYRNRLLVMINWAWAYLTFEHGVRLIVPSDMGVPKKEMQPESERP